MTKSMRDYIKGFPEKTQRLLKQMRSTIHALAPDATETISYGVPTFVLNGNLVHFAGYKNHIGFYPGALAMKTFKAEMGDYKFAKGSVQFPLNKPLPFPLIRKIVKFRLKMNREKRLKKTAATPKNTSQAFPDGLAAPARRALVGAKIGNLSHLAKITEKQLKDLHGMGPKAISLLKDAMRKQGLKFK